MASGNSAVRLADGSFDFSYGVDSSRVTTVQSQSTPQGLPRNSLAWMNNGTVRGGGIQPRAGWLQVLMVIAKDNGLYQGGFLYAPQFANPYLILQINGRIYKALVEAPFSVTDLSALSGLTNPASVTQVYMEQGEQFLVIQAGDNDQPNPTLPLFWDGTTLRRSRGLVNPAIPPQPPVPTQYKITFTASWIMPAVGTPVTTNIAVAYPGAVGDTLSSDSGLGTFTVMTGTAGLMLVLQPTATPITGATITADTYPFTVVLPAPPTPTPFVPELPAAGPMVYYAGRLWYAQGTKYTAGDIVGGPSGTLPYDFTDSILKVTENPLAIGGDGFSVPGQSGNITAMFYTGNLNTQLGQGPLYISTRKSIYSLSVPVSRQDWIGANNNNQPVQTVAQKKYGAVGDRCIAHVNEDAFYQSLEPAIRSLTTSIRNFGQWGNVPISNNENRVLGFNNRALMKTATGIEFDNRLLQGILPVQTPVGVAFQGIAPLDFDLISTLQEKRPPAWEGMLEGLNILQLFEADFGGRSRAFAVVWSDPSLSGDGGIGVWELTDYARWDKTDPEGNRINWYFETPAWTFEEEFKMKQLDGGEIWLDKVSGTVDLKLEYRPDADACWKPWFQTEFCSAANTCETVDNPVCYPTAAYCDSQKFPITLPVPPVQCVPANARPSNWGYQFQVRVTIKGYCRVRGMLFYATERDRQPFLGLNQPSNGVKAG